MMTRSKNESGFCGLFHDTGNRGVARSGHVDVPNVFNVNAGFYRDDAGELE
jgi:hypothetical protein